MPDLTTTSTFVAKNEVQPVCWWIVPTVRCTVHMCLLNSDTDVYVVHNENVKKGQNKQKSTAVCRTGTSFAKLRLALCFVSDYKGV